MSDAVTEDEFVKWLVVTFPTGERYGVPARIVAEDRASYYVQCDSPDDEEKRGKKRQQELDETLENPAELIEWARTNMEWDDLRHHAERLDSAERDLGDLWMDADFNVKPANEVEYD